MFRKHRTDRHKNLNEQFTFEPLEQRHLLSAVSLLQTLDNPTPASNDNFGHSVAIDGNTTLIGTFSDDTGAADSGAAYLFDTSSGTLLHTLNNPSPAPDDRFGGLAEGTAVAISGSLAVVGAPGDDTGAFDAGSVYVFDTSTGSLLQSINNPSPANNARFGYSVAISGNHVVIGSTGSGVVYLFNASTGAHLQTYVNPSPSTDDRFGNKVAVSGNRVLTSAYRNDTGATDAGAAYLFDLQSGNLLHTFANPTPEASDFFGFSVAVTGDDVVIGALKDDVNGANTGGAYLFDATTGNLLHTIGNPTPASGDQFGLSVAVSGDMIAVGESLDDVGAGNSGAVHLFDVTTGGLIQSIENPTPDPGDQFGWSVAMSDGQLVVGAIGDDTIASNSGAAYLFGNPAQPFVVTSTLDTIDANDGVTTLREAILNANSTPGLDTITFAIPGTPTIQLTSALPDITEEAVIDGDSQAGVTIDAAGVTGIALSVLADNVTLADFAIADAAGTAVHLLGVDFAVLNRLDLSWGGSTPTGTSVLLYDSENVFVENITATNRSHGILLDESSNNTVRNNNVSGAGSAGINLRGFSGGNLLEANDASASLRGIYAQSSGLGNQYVSNDLSDILAGTGQYGLHIENDTDFLVAGNDFTNSRGGVLLQNMDGLTLNATNFDIDVSTAGKDFLRAALRLENVNNSSIDGLNLSQAGTAAGVGLWIVNSDNNTVTNVAATNREDGIQITNSSDNTIVTNNVSSATSAGIRINGSSSGNLIQSNDASGSLRGIFANSTGLGNQYVSNDLSDILAGTGQYGLHIENDTQFVVDSNDFSNSRGGVLLKNMDGLTLDATNFDIDVSTAGADFLRAGLRLENITNSTIDGLDLSQVGGTAGVGLWLVGGSANTITNLTSSNREVGVQVTSSAGNQLQCSSILDNNRGVLVDGTTAGLTLFDNHLAGNSTGVDSVVAASVAAENNFWGAPSGPANLGGAGDSYSGNVDADPFLTGLPSCLGGNQAPTITVDTAGVSVDEGTTAQNSGTFNDADATDIVTLSASSGDVQDNGDGTWSWSFNSTNQLATTAITITATDLQGEASSVEFDLTVNNVAPTVSIAPTTTVLDEGQTFTAAGSFTDPSDDTWTATVNYGDGSGSQPLVLNPDKTFSLENTYGDSGEYSVTVSVTDDSGAIGFEVLSVTVNNVAPVVDLGTGATIDEGDTWLGSGSFTDPGDGSFHTPTAFSILSPQGDATATPQIIWEASSGAVSYDVVISSTPDGLTPVVTAAGLTSNTYTTAALAAGEYFVFVTAKDGAANEIIAANDGTSFLVGDSTEPAEPYHLIFVTSEVFEISGDGSFPPAAGTISGLAGADWQVNAAAHAAGLLPNWNGIDIIYKALLSDSGSSARDRLAISSQIFNTAGELVASDSADLWDGSIENPIAFDEFGLAVTSNVVWTGSVPSGDFTSEACDDWADDGSSGGTGDASMTNALWIEAGGIDCTEPARLYAISPAIIPAATSTATTESSSEPAETGPLATSLIEGDEGWTATVDYGDGSGVQALALAADNTFALQHEYQDDGTYTVTVNVSDADGGTGVQTLLVTVNNVAPVLANVTTDSTEVGDAAAGELVNFSADFTDVGVLDTHTATIDWGDGTSSAGVVDQLAGTVTGDHVYAHGGIFTVTVTLTDDDSGQDVATTTSVVSGLGEQDGVLQIVGTSGHDFVKVFRSWSSGDYKVLSRLDGSGWDWQSFDDESVSEIEMYLGDGDDLGFVSRRVHVDATIDAGNGDDFLAGGSGNDVLLAGDGYDLLFGGGGRDLMIAGTGGDLIFGEGGSDILISGTTAFDNDRGALDLIMAEWTSSRSYTERVENITGNDLGVTFDDRENEEIFLIAEGENATVFDDESVDWLLGGRGKDLYFGGEDDISFARFNEILEEIEAEDVA